MSKHFKKNHRGGGEGDTGVEKAEMALREICLRASSPERSSATERTGELARRLILREPNMGTVLF